MAGINLVTGLAFDLGNRSVERIRLKVQLCAADPANQVMVIVSGQLIGQVTTANLGGMDNAVPGQEFQRAVDGGLGHTGLVDALVNLRRGEMPTIMQGLQDGKTLGGHAIAAFTQGPGVDGKAGHVYSLLQKLSIIIICNKAALSTKEPRTMEWNEAVRWQPISEQEIRLPGEMDQREHVWLSPILK